MAVALVILTAARLVMAPMLILQGRRVRRVVQRLPEAAGDREALIGAGGEALRVLIVGDSATAGVGAAHQREALAGRLGERLLERLQAPYAALHWRLVARSGATAAEALELLEADSIAEQARPGARPMPSVFAADVAVLAVGVNDVTGQLPVERWLQHMEALARRTEEVHGARALIVSGLPPMHLFPALPQPLRWYLGACAQRYDRALLRWAAQRPGTRFVALPAMRDPALMASDGFHPGPPAYRIWAEVLAAEIASAVAAEFSGRDPFRGAGAAALPPGSR